MNRENWTGRGGKFTNVTSLLAYLPGFDLRAGQHLNWCHGAIYALVIPEKVYIP